MTRDRDAAEGRDANAARVSQDRQARAREGIALPRATLENIQQFLLDESLKESRDPIRAQRIKAMWEEVREALK